MCHSRQCTLQLKAILLRSQYRVCAVLTCALQAKAAALKIADAPRNKPRAARPMGTDGQPVPVMGRRYSIALLDAVGADALPKADVNLDSDDNTDEGSCDVQVKLGSSELSLIVCVDRWISAGRHSNAQEQERV